MLTPIIVRFIEFCTRHAWLTIAIGILLAGASGLYAARHFAINSDINALLSPSLDWRKRELAFEQAFSRYQVVIAVVETPTPELTSQATDALTQALAGRKDRFLSVSQPASGEFFSRHALLFQSPDELKGTVAQLKKG